ncbi:pyridoxamine 5'-phosphate oxidase family protein [Embleya sp. NPDC020886]|uniref:pyridoxamine 5'-phosphate oxidase family protein n=1 Tax=Embleya sp. NPDC020886 TaxID=3363980 RepID=UPI0037B4FC22
MPTSPTSPTSPTGSPNLVDAALRILRSHAFGFLAGTDTAGAPRVRLVQHLAVEDDATIRIGTSPRSRKAVDLIARPQVCYSVEDRAAVAYATFYARAELVCTGPELVTHWDETLRPFFPAGPTGGDFALVRLVPHRVELVDFTAGIHPDPYGLVAAVAQVP